MSIGIEQVRNRLKILDDRAKPIKAELDSLVGQEQTPENVKRFNELAAGLQVMLGRHLECEAWIELLEQYPGVSRPEQLPTKANTPAYVPITEKASGPVVTRHREGANQRDAIELTNLLPDAE